MVVKINSKFDLRRLCNAVGATPLVRLGKVSEILFFPTFSTRSSEFGRSLCRKKWVVAVWCGRLSTARRR